MCEKVSKELKFKLQFKDLGHYVSLSQLFFDVKSLNILK